MRMFDVITTSPQEKNRILVEYFEEKEIRETNPTVKLAWEHYKTLLKLAHHGKEPEPIDETQFG